MAQLMDISAPASMPIAKPIRRPAVKMVRFNDISPVKLSAQKRNIYYQSREIANSPQRAQVAPRPIKKPQDLSVPANVITPIDFGSSIKKQSILQGIKSTFNFRQMLIDGFVAALITLGEIIPMLQTRPILIIIPYIWAVIFFSIKSKETFTLAMILFACMPFLAISGKQFQAEVFANLALLVLVVGIVTAALELRANRYDKIIG